MWPDFKRRYNGNDWQETLRLRRAARTAWLNKLSKKKNKKT